MIEALTSNVAIVLVIVGCLGLWAARNAGPWFSKLRPSITKDLRPSLCQSLIVLRDHCDTLGGEDKSACEAACKTLSPLVIGKPCEKKEEPPK
jgi:hypothetical protein